MNSRKDISLVRGMSLVEMEPKNLILQLCRTVHTRGSSVVAARYGLDGPVVESRWGATFSAPFHTGSEVHSASYTVGTGSFTGVTRPGRGVDHPPLLSARLKEE